MPDVWTVKAILDWCEGYLARKNDPNPRLSAQWLLSEALGLSRIELYTSFDKPLTASERDTMREWVRRRGAGEPLQLISGKAPFRYITVSIKEGVLIPRPETEVLVSEAFEELALPSVSERVVVCDEAEVIESSDAYPISVLDLCTGSGCIACAIAHEYPQAQVLATDISSVACDLARHNSEDLGLEERVSVQQNDLMHGMTQRYSDVFDLIISNPPYIPTKVLSSLDGEVTNFEPALALDGGDDGLDILRCFLDDARVCLKPDGVLAVELFEESLAEAAQLARLHGYDRVRVAKDLTGRDRILVARKPSEGNVE